MLQYLQRRREDDQGFTLIELMVVVLIIAILIAIAIPTFLGAQNRARDRAAQSDLRNSYTAAKSISTDFEGTWKTSSAACTDTGSAFATALTAENGSLSYVAGAAMSETNINVQVSNSAATSPCDQLLLQRRSTSGKHFCFAANKTGATARGVNDPGAAFGTYAACTGATTKW